MDTDGATLMNIYGGLEGPESMYLKLISSDGHEFVVRRDFAITSSPTIKNMLSGPGQYSELQPNEIYLKDIPSHVLIHLCRYFSYKIKYTNSSVDIPEFPMDVQVVVEVLVASDFLDC
ncbi:unnamed protein product [Adineta steineri]|uniref:Elongin-C n=1 Tax=Adineta steineri TaxID=433720 RepID=A0A818PM37_9BILA|nr:unnamed protein product [Adineta steineri]CAF3627101.1 unnamed protein product [Adineta steineri]